MGWLESLRRMHYVLLSDSRLFLKLIAGKNSRIALKPPSVKVIKPIKPWDCFTATGRLANGRFDSFPFSKQPKKMSVS